MPELVMDAHRRMVPIDHPDRSVVRTKLEYPTERVSFSYLATRDAVMYCGLWGVAVLARDIFADKAVFAAVQVNAFPLVLARLLNNLNFYSASYHPGYLGCDFWMFKVVGGVETWLAYEVIDIGVDARGIAISCLGTTIKAMRYDMPSPIDPLSLPTPNMTISATDTSFSSGRFGYRPLREDSPHGGATPDSVYLMPPMSPSPRPIAYFEVPVVGSGTPEDPYKAQMPEHVEWDWSMSPKARRKYEVLRSRGFSDDEIVELFPDVLLCRVNRLALTNSALIASGADGKPKEYVAIVRIYDEGGGQRLYPLDRRIAELQRIPGVRKLTREEAIRRAKQLDDKLTDIDLLPVDGSDVQFKQKLRDYIAHRISLGVRAELIDEKIMERYLVEEKGW